MRKKKNDKSVEKQSEKASEKASGKPRRKYLDGNLREMTSAWKKMVMQRIEERGWTHAKLADALGCNRSLVAKMLAEEQTSSRLVDRVCLILQIEEPLTAAKSKDSLDDFVSRLTEGDRARALEILTKSFDAIVS